MVDEAPGALFEEQAARGQLDDFAVLALPAETPNITVPMVRTQFMLDLKHVFQRGTGKPTTTARNVPTWLQLNTSKDNLDTKEKIERAVEHWKYTSIQVWNPAAAVGSEGVKQPPTSSGKCMQLYLPLIYVLTLPP
jgi:hypothetical protein